MKTIREDIYNLIFDEYSVEPEFPWSDAPDACVFRHSDNRKWFAIIMTVKNSSLGINKEGHTDCINVKIVPEDIYDLLEFELSKIWVNAVTPLVLLGSYWYDEPFKTVRFFGDEYRTIEMSSPIMKLIPHCYVLGIKVEQQYKTYNAVPIQSNGNKSIPLTGGGSN